ncbi:MAG: cusB [Chitinophagaceae bacterium]|nr:cusB [Chitinophagaceae bacterium]
MKKILFILTTFFLLACAKDKDEAIADNEFYTCSMDPQVMEKKPGKCPICKMELTKVIIDKNHTQGFKLSKEQEQLANIQILKISEGELGKEKTVNGRLVINENKRFKISSRVSGRIEKLFIKNAGESIKAGTLLYELYSEELMAAQKEYLLGIEKSNEPDYAQLTDGAKNKLLLWGMSEKQIHALAKSRDVKNTVAIYSRMNGVVTVVNVQEGDYVMDGDVLLEIADLSTLWVEAEIYSDEIHDFDRNNPITIRINEWQGKTWNSRITFATPQLELQSKVNIIRAEIPNKDMSLKPGMQANILLKGTTRTTISVPINAVLQDSKGATVWIKKEDGTYESRMVVTGIQSNDRIEIRSGLEPGEEVVINGAYLLNSEYIFKRGANPMEGHDMSTM